MKKVLIISQTHTHPTNMGNCWGILAQCEILKKIGCEVDFFYIQDRGLNPKHQNEYDEIIHRMREYWGEHLYIYILPKYKKILKTLIRRFRERFCNYKIGTFDNYIGGIEHQISELHNNNKYDACIIQYIFNAKLFDKVKFPKMAVYTHDIQAYRNVAVGANVLWIDASQEAECIQRCTDVFAVQDEEQAYFKVLSPKSKTYSIYCMYEYCEQPLVNNRNIVFLSGNNSLNISGLKWFLDSIYPLIKNKYPDSKLLIAGGICKVIGDLCQVYNDVQLLGYVDNPADLYKLGDIAINPTYQGTGIKTKTFEAMAYGKVTLAHPHSLIGMYKKETIPLFTSDSPEAWINYLENIWENPDAMRAARDANRDYITDLLHHITNEYKRFLEII